MKPGRTADYSIRALQSPSDYQACVELQRLTWGPDFHEAVPATTLKLAQRLGGIAAGAFDNGTLLGFVFGLTGLEAGVLTHWSDMMAVRPEARGRGIGEALKWYQREQLLERGITRVRWSFDPLEARNAYLNIARLGATAREYVRDMYEGSTSALHAGIGTDRLILTWQLDSDRVQSRATGRPADPLRDAPLVNEVEIVAGRAVSRPARLDLTTSAVRIAIPLDIQSLKQADPALAQQWRMHTRRAFEHYLQSYEVMDFVREAGFGAYTLQRAD